MTTTKSTALDQLDALHQDVARAEGRVIELGTERQKAKREAERPKADLRDYYEAIGAGEREPDTQLERKLDKAVRAAEDQASALEERYEAQIAGARRAVATAQGRVAAFLAEHRDELTEEMTARSFEARDRLFAAYDELVAAIGHWSAVRKEWEPMLVAWGISSTELPRHNPAGGTTGDLERAFAPMDTGKQRPPAWFIPAPVSLLPGELRGELVGEPDETMRAATRADVARHGFDPVFDLSDSERMMMNR